MHAVAFLRTPIRTWAWQALSSPYPSTPLHLHFLPIRAGVAFRTTFQLTPAPSVHLPNLLPHRLHYHPHLAGHTHPSCLPHLYSLLPALPVSCLWEGTFNWTNLWHMDQQKRRGAVSRRHQTLWLYAAARGHYLGRADGAGRADRQHAADSTRCAAPCAATQSLVSPLTHLPTDSPASFGTHHYTTAPHLCFHYPIPHRLTRAACAPLPPRTQPHHHHCSCGDHAPHHARTLPHTPHGCRAAAMPHLLPLHATHTFQRQAALNVVNLKLCLFATYGHRGDRAERDARLKKTRGSLPSGRWRVATRQRDGGADVAPCLRRAATIPCPSMQGDSTATTSAGGAHTGTDSNLYIL